MDAGPMTTAVKTENTVLLSLQWNFRNIAKLCMHAHSVWDFLLQHACTSHIWMVCMVWMCYSSVSPFVISLGLFDGFGWRSVLFFLQVGLQLLGSFQVLAAFGSDALLCPLPLSLICRNNNTIDLCISFLHLPRISNFWSYVLVLSDSDHGDTKKRREE